MLADHVDEAVCVYDAADRVTGSGMPGCCALR
jgi:hypothetical protein